jgi:hypothetical protein
MKKHKKSPLTIVQEKLWEECKRIIRARYPHTCYTCGRTGLEGVNLQTGHMIPKAVLPAILKYDLRVLRPQCFHCNINLGGNGALFIENMRKREGNAYVNKIQKDRNKILPGSALEFYTKLLEKYRKLSL